MKMIPEKDWEWYGDPGHFICSHDCRFHLCTVIGEYIVSTVGKYFPDAPVREILAESRGIKLTGRGDERRNDFLEKIGYEEIGLDRTYETMVFKSGERCNSKGCNCGMPSIASHELEFSAYNDPKSANEGHLALCYKAAKGEINESTS